jgi:homospermidine synthase
MVSWFVKQALLDVADAVGLGCARPTSRLQWAELMREAGVRWIHIAERDTQRGRKPKASRAGEHHRESQSRLRVSAITG